MTENFARMGEFSNKTTPFPRTRFSRSEPTRGFPERVSDCPTRGSPVHWLMILMVGLLTPTIVMFTGLDQSWATTSIRTMEFQLHATLSHLQRANFNVIHAQDVVPAVTNTTSSLRAEGDQKHSTTTTSQTGLPNSTMLDEKIGTSWLQQLHRPCSCYNSTSFGSEDDKINFSESCCQRMVVSTHKFGRYLSNALFHRFWPAIDRPIYSPDLILHPPPRKTNNQVENPDYRHVALVRNIYAAVVSGYLYHRSGRECWVNGKGHSYPPDRVPPKSEWEQAMNKSIYSQMVNSIPLARNRNICQYLVDESEIDGMKAYIGWMMAVRYKDIVPYIRNVHERTQLDNNLSRTLVVCFEDLSNPATQEPTYLQMMDFLFPGGHNYKYPKKIHGPGGHKTDKNPILRTPLVQLVHQLDETVFGGTLAEINSYYNCSDTTSKLR